MERLPGIRRGKITLLASVPLLHFPIVGEESDLRQPHGGFSLLPNEAKRDILAWQPNKEGLQSYASGIPTPTPEWPRRQA